MPKAIGELFSAELVTAGCNAGVSFTIGGTDADIQVDGVLLSDAKGTHADAVRSVVQAHDATAGAHNRQIDAQISALENEHPLTMRDYRETKLAMAISAGLPAAWLDPDQPDPSDLSLFKNLGFGLRIAVLQERGARALRAQRT